MKWALFIFADNPHGWSLWGLFDTPREAFAEQTRQRVHAPRLRCIIRTWRADEDPREVARSLP